MISFCTVTGTMDSVLAVVIVNSARCSIAWRCAARSASVTADKLDAGALGKTLSPRVALSCVVVGNVICSAGDASDVGGTRQRHGINALRAACVDGGTGIRDGGVANLRRPCGLGGALVNLVGQLGHAGCILFRRFSTVRILVDKRLQVVKKFLKCHC